MEGPRLTSPAQMVDRGASEGDELDLADLAAQILARKWFVALVAASAALIGLFLGQLPPNEYRALSVAQIEKRSSGIMLPEELIGTLLNGEQSARSELETEFHIIKSRLTLGPVVRELRQDQRVVPLRAPIIGDLVARLRIPVFDALIPDRFQRPDEYVSLSALNIANDLMEASLVLEVTGPTSYEVRGPSGISGSGTVGAPLGLSDGISLTVAEIAAPAGRQYYLFREPERRSAGRINEALSVRERGKSGIVDFLYTGDDREEAVILVNAVVASYAEQNLRRRSAEIDQSIAFIETQLPDVRAELSMAADALAAYREAEQGSELSLGTQDLLIRVVEVETALEDVDYREEQLAQTLTPNHPDYRALLAERERLQRRLGELRAGLRDVPVAEQELARLTEHVERARQLELQLTARVEQLRVLKASTVGNIRVLEAAEVARLVGPNRMRPVLLGFVIGSVFAIGFVLARNMLRRGVEDAREIESLGLSLYGSVGRVEALANKKAGSPDYALALYDPQNLAVEALRGLRTGLQFALAAAGTKSLMITSCAPSDGKSFVSLNLSIVTAQIGTRVLLVDCDMRRGELGKHFRRSRRDPGLSDYLANRRPLEDCLVRDETTGVEFIGTGAFPPNPAELLANARFDELINAATEHYDVVILDAPPALAVTDPAIIGQRAGVTLFVARHLVTTKAEVQSAQKTLATGGVGISGVVLNQYDQKRSRYGYYSSRYSYHYGGYRYKYET